MVPERLCPSRTTGVEKVSERKEPRLVARNEIRFSLNGIILLRSENALHLESGYTGRNVKASDLPARTAR